MKRSMERRSIITQAVAERGYVSVEELASACGTSTQTIRRDLTLLVREGAVRKYHGGAASIPGDVVSPYAERSAANIERKRIIARLVAGLIPEEASVFLSGGSTLTEVATELARHSRLFVVTNNLHAGIALYDKKGFQVLVAGGMIRADSGSLTGEETLSMIKKYRADYAIITASSLSTEGDILELDPEAVSPIKQMLKSVRRRILAVDSTKFNDQGTVRSARLSDINILVSDRPPPAIFQKLCKENGVQIVVPEDSQP